MWSKCWNFHFNSTKATNSLFSYYESPIRIIRFMAGSHVYIPILHRLLERHIMRQYCYVYHDVFCRIRPFRIFERDGDDDTFLYTVPAPDRLCNRSAWNTAWNWITLAAIQVPCFLYAYYFLSADITLQYLCSHEACRFTESHLWWQRPQLSLVQNTTSAIFYCVGLVFWYLE